MFFQRYPVGSYFQLCPLPNFCLQIPFILGTALKVGPSGLFQVGVAAGVCFSGVSHPGGSGAISLALWRAEFRSLGQPACFSARLETLARRALPLGLPD